MKINLPRQNIYLLILSVFLFIFVLLFSFIVLIPEGKNYRAKKTELKKENLELKQLSDFSNEKEIILQNLQSDNSHIITAFDAKFDAQKFEKEHKVFFGYLKVSKKSKVEDEDDFEVYEVNTTSEISSPKSFYDFLDSLNKSNWIIAVNFPINFRRDREMISSSFTMRVYGNKELNSSK